MITKVRLGSITCITITYRVVFCIAFFTHEDKSVRISQECKEERINFNLRGWEKPLGLFVDLHGNLGSSYKYETYL